MNKTIGIVIAILVIVGGAYLLLHHKPASALATTKSDTSSVQTQTPSNSPSSLKSLLALGKSQQCTFSSDENGATSTGTFYISAGKSRGDISATVAGKATTTHMIYDNSTSYVWTDGSNTGFKMAMNPDQTATQSQTSSQGVDPNKNYNFNCHDWSADTTMFSPPLDIQFKDFSVPTLPGAAAGASTSSSASTNPAMNADTVCAGLSGTAKTQCVAAFQKK